MQQQTSFYQKRAGETWSPMDSGPKKITDVNFGLNFWRLWMYGVAPLKKAGWMQTIWMYTPIDFIMEKYWILKDSYDWKTENQQRNSMKSYLGKGIKDPIEIQAIDEYFAYFLWVSEPGDFTAYLQEKDYEPVVAQSEQDKQLAMQMKTDEEQRAKDREAIQNTDMTWVVAAMQEQNQLLRALIKANGLLPSVPANVAPVEQAQEAKQEVIEAQWSSEAIIWESIQWTMIATDWKTIEEEIPKAAPVELVIPDKVLATDKIQEDATDDFEDSLIDEDERKAAEESDDI